jgi:hypothetical protein
MRNSSSRWRNVWEDGMLKYEQPSGVAVGALQRQKPVCRRAIAGIAGSYMRQKNSRPEGRLAKKWLRE